MIAQKTDTTAPSARKSHIGIVYSILMVLLLLVLFLLSPANKVYASVVLTAVLVIATGLFGREELDETKMSLPMILCLFGLAGSILLTMAISPYSMRDLFIDTSFLLLTVLFFYCIRPSSFEISPFMKRVFYCLALAVVLVSVFRRDAETPYYVFGSYDKNYFGVVLFLFFCWCWYEKRKLGVAVCSCGSRPQQQGISNDASMLCFNKCCDMDQSATKGVGFSAFEIRASCRVVFALRSHVLFNRDV